MTRRPRVLALDLALSRTGIAVGTETLQVGVIDTFDKWSGPQRRRHIIRELRTHVELFRPDLVVIEALPPRGQVGVIERAKVFGVVEQYLDPRVPFMYVDCQHLKMYALGKGGGKGTDKDDVRIAVERRYRHLVECATHDEADALVLLAMTLHHYGHPLAAVPQTHAQALTRVTWPNLPHLDCPSGTATHTDSDAGRAPTGGTR